MAVSQGILGVRPDYDGLRIQPCLPDQMECCRIERLFRGTRYEITVRRGEHKGLVVDGTPLSGNQIPLTDAKSCAVELTI